MAIYRMLTSYWVPAKTEATHLHDAKYEQSDAESYCYTKPLVAFSVQPKTQMALKAVQ